MILVILTMLALMCNFINPYLGLFGLFPSVSMMIASILEVNLVTRVELSQYIPSEMPEYTSHLSKQSRKIATLWRIVAIILFIIFTPVTIFIWLMLSGRLWFEPTIATPWVMFGSESLDRYSIILLMLSILLHLVHTALVVYKSRVILNRDFELEYSEYLSPKDIESIRFNISISAITCFTLAVIFGMINPYISWIAIPINMGYVLLFVLMPLILWVIKRRAIVGDKPVGNVIELDNRREHVKVYKRMLAHHANFLLANLRRGGKYNKLFIFVVWLVAFISITGTCLTLAIRGYSLTSNFDSIAVILAIIFALLTAVCITMSVRSIGVEKEEVSDAEKV